MKNRPEIASSQEWEERRREVVNNVLGHIFDAMDDVEMLKPEDVVTATRPGNEQSMIDLCYYGDMMGKLSEVLHITGEYLKAPEKLREQGLLDWLTLGIGELKVNLLSLEFLMRAYLCRLEGGKTHPPLFNLEEGEAVEENALTNYDDLNTVIEKYNRAVVKDDEDLAVGDWVTPLRDALAHGRMVAQYPYSPFVLYKFSKPRAGKVEVTHAVKITRSWLKEQSRRVRRETEKVQSALRLHDDRDKKTL